MQAYDGGCISKKLASFVRGGMYADIRKRGVKGNRGIMVSPCFPDPARPGRIPCFHHRKGA